MSEGTLINGQFGPNDPKLKRFIKPSIWNAIPHFLPLGIFPLIFLAGIYGGWWLLPAFLFMSITGLFDKLLGVDGKSIDPQTTSEKSLFWHNLPVWIWAFMWPPTLIFGMWQILISGNLSVWESIVFVVILAMEAQAVFVIGHELIHRRVAWERRVGEFLLASATYPTYATEHVYIHHAKVGTPYDVGSAPKGESFWHYLPKELISNITNSWKIDRERLARRGLLVWHYTNPFWRYIFGVAFWLGLAYAMGGIWAIPVFIFLGFGCVFSMKISNYLQHYGLRRVLLPNGRWEKVAPRHSWSADWKFSNWMFFNMQRHADHHATASRHYPLLQVRGPEESPELPGTYADMMNIVLRPKKWFEKMDPLVEQWRKHFYPQMDDWSAYDSPLAMARPDEFPAIVELFASSPRLAKWIESHPKYLDSIKEKEFIDLDLPKGFSNSPEFDSAARKGLARFYWTVEMDVKEIKERIAEWPAADANETAQIVQSWSNEKAFQCGMHVIRGNLTPKEAAIAYSNLAEACVSVILTAVVEDFVERTGPLPVSICAVFLGDLATKEVQPSSTLKYVLIQNSSTEILNEHVFSRFNEVLEKFVEDSLIFSQLSRASGTRSAFSLEEFEEFCIKQPQEAVDFVHKSRIVYHYGDNGLVDGFETKLKKITEFLVAQGPKSELINFEKLTYKGNSPLTSNVATNWVQTLEKFAHYLQLHKENKSKNKMDSAEIVLTKHGFDELSNCLSTWRTLMGAFSHAGGEHYQEFPLSVQKLIHSIVGCKENDSLELAVEGWSAETLAHLENSNSKLK